ncbi:site-specific DNA-methyltransferase [Billgrantia sulfidoxydans]|uniref:Site-specific DNA-methyltransferase n=1 Tax=Billgrantia sulfidoxydans TaxID=2733484 RepID=A0ABX7W6F9_9GAMM|nr:DNA methyltransferase [Halomonas sulfidoxydans]QTP55846.1 site-specific DNA-methyltransferase [Halomonas sulfidoxydans]
MAVATTDDRRQRFIDLLHELFQLDKPELDFGLYRIMHAKSDQLSRFIREDLAQAIEEAFAEQGEEQLATMRQEIEEKRRQAEELGAPDPDSAPAVKQARAAYDVAKREQNASADIYDHLYRFFSRYYDKGDFMSRRHHVAENDSRAAPYAVPYDGREVYLHWANKDQYYVKSSETLANFTFNLNEALKKLHGSAAQGGLGFDSVDAALKVHCRVVDATEGEHNDVKESTERFFIIHHDEPVRLEGADLVLQFEYRPDPEKTGQSGTWQKKRLEEAEEFIMAALRLTDGVAAFREGLATRAPTDKQKERTLLGKYLQQYTARNTMDYFIHKDLGGFLSRELDFYIKNEILRLDDIDNADVLIVEQQLKKIQVLRKIAKQIIIFLSQLENFQRKLWLKKKFVLSSDYCISLDILKGCEDLVVDISSNEEQRRQWEKYCSVDLNELDEVLDGEGPAGILSSSKFKFLMVDTGLLSEKLKIDILSRSGVSFSSLDGILVQSDNFQAIRMAERTFEKSMPVCYIDPPYNTGDDGFVYKDSYKDSSWLAMLYDRISSSLHLMTKDAFVVVSFDDVEIQNFGLLADEVFGSSNRLARLVWDRNRKNDAKYFSVGHEYMAVYCLDKEGLDKSGRKLRELKAGVDEAKAEFERIKKRVGNDLGKIHEEWKFFVSSVKDSETKSILSKYPKMSLRGPYRDDGNINWPGGKGPRYEVLHPQTKLPVKIPKSGWRYSKPETFWDKYDRGEISFGRDEKTVPGVVYYLFENSRQVMGSVFWSYAQNTNNAFEAIMGDRVFDNPKDVKDIGRLLSYFGKNGWVIDYFSGSGTTGVSVINSKRLGEGGKKYFLVEMGEYFSDVIKPRLVKSAYSQDWKGGAPLEDDKGELNGVAQCFKYLRLESYDDTLNNLELDDNPQRDALMEQNAELRRDYTLKYLLDVETRGSASLLNTEWFRDPEGYTLKVKQPGSDETRETAVDLVETFNWLIGLHVTHLDKPRTYIARFTREEDPELPEDQNTRLKAEGLRENEDGAYWIRQVEGHVRRIPGSDEDLAKVLVVWRKLTDDPEKDAAVLEALLEKYKIGTTDSEFDAIYINGPHGLNLTGSARSRVHSLEETFHARMWEGCDDEL